MRLHSAPVIRLADAKRIQLSDVLKADGRFRLIAFADKNDFGGENGKIAALCRFLTTDPSSPVLRHTPHDLDPDAVIDLRAVLRYSRNRTAISICQRCRSRYSLRRASTV
jgi:phenol 2-monooxygenase